MARISKRIRTLAADLLSACAFECAQTVSGVFIYPVAEIFLADEQLDLYTYDQVMLVAACTFRGCSSIEPYPQCWIENYLEAAARLREGFTPNMDT